MLLLGTKVGMTRLLDGGKSVPVTVLRIGPCVVTQVKTADKDGYTAVQVAYGDMKPRNCPIPQIGHDAKAGTTPKRFHREFRVAGDDAGKFTVGQELTVKDLEGTMFVDVIGTSKGKGFAGVMKRHHCKCL